MSPFGKNLQKLLKIVLINLVGDVFHLLISVDFISDFKQETNMATCGGAGDGGWDGGDRGDGDDRERRRDFGHYQKCKYCQKT